MEKDRETTLSGIGIRQIYQHSVSWIRMNNKSPISFKSRCDKLRVVKCSKNGKRNSSKLSEKQGRRQREMRNRK